jgi:integrase
MQLGLDFSAPSPCDAGRSTREPSKRPPEVYSADEIKPLLLACKKNDIGQRHRALVVLLWRSGLRIAEALSLCPTDLDPTNGAIQIRHGKGGKPRIVGADPAMFEELRPWLECRARRGLGNDTPLFCPLKGGALDDSYVRHALRRLARDAKFDRRIHPHAFRHSHAAELWLEGCPEKVIQAQLGHSCLDTTDKYLRKVGTTEQVLAMMRTRTPWNDR